MRSFQIYNHLNNNPHANDNNATRERLKRILAGRLSTLQADSLTVTAEDGGIYQAYSTTPGELSFLQTTLENQNITTGGNCTLPTVNIFDQANCLNYNTTDQQQWDASLSLADCNRGASPNISTNTILSMVTAFCAARAPEEESDSLLNLGFILWLAVAVMCLTAGAVVYRRMQSPPNNRGWLEDRQLRSIDRANAMLSSVQSSGDNTGMYNAHDNAHLENEDDGLYDAHAAEAGRTASGYTRLTQGPG